MVRPATSADLPTLAETLANAFHDDPFFTWLLPDDDRRRRAGQRFFDAITRQVYFAKGETYTVDGGRAAALWAPPDNWQIPLSRQLRLAPAMLRSAGRRTPPLLRVLTDIEKKHPREPHFYLAILGTDPSMQNQGLGSALLAQMLERCDREGLPAYLEASSVRSRALYFRHGFKEIEEVRVLDAPPFWLMWREPRGA